MLRGNNDVLEEIFGYVEKPRYDAWYEEHINRKDTPFMIWPKLSQPEVKIHFPPPRDININMMPIHLGQGLFSTLPENCKHYAEFIWSHCFAQGWLQDSNGLFVHQIGYSTIHEGYVPVGESQRRPGVHIERPGKICGGNWNERGSDKYKEIKTDCLKMESTWQAQLTVRAQSGHY